MITKDTETEEVSPSELQEALDAAGKLLSPQSDSRIDNDQRLGVLQRLVQAVTDDKQNQYRQTLHTANFPDEKAAHLAAAAINQLERYGLPVSIIMNHIECENGIKGESKNRILEALTHYQFTTNYQSNGKKQSNSSKRTPL